MYQMKIVKERDFMKVGFVSLGCSKNLIDTEIAIGYFKKNKFKIVNNPNEAEIIVINTCGFIESAKEEAINTILEMAEYKKKKCMYLIVIGCLVQRYKNELEKSLPEVDLFIKIEEYDKLWQKIKELIDKGKTSNKINTNKKEKITQMPMFKEEEYLQRTISTGENYAYLKIGEGCSNMCTYCAIPYIRGTFVSRPMEDILKEAKMLGEKGIKELIVIAQDTTKYGIDIYGKSKLAELLEKISKIENIKWIQVLYIYPEGITDELIETVKNNKKISKYFDIPIQHISNEILKRMNRKTTKEKIEKIIRKIRKEIPEAVIRTSLIVGFPGESKENFEELYKFVNKIEFERLGVFEYSREDGTPAAKMENQIHYMTKKSRRNKIMIAQQKISYKKLKEKIGKEIDVLIENISLDKRYFVGRSNVDIPEEDGVIYVEKEKGVNLNQIVKCKITDVKEYDLIAKIKK